MLEFGKTMDYSIGCSGVAKSAKPMRHRPETSTLRRTLRISKSRADGASGDLLRCQKMSACSAAPLFSARRYGVTKGNEDRRFCIAEWSMAIWMRRWGLLKFGKRLMMPPCRKGPVVSRPDFRMGLRHAACSRQARTTSLSPSMVQGAQVLLSRCSILAYNIFARAALSYSVAETTLRLIYPAIYPPRCLQPDIRCSSNHHSALGPYKA